MRLAVAIAIHGDVLCTEVGFPISFRRVRFGFDSMMSISSLPLFFCELDCEDDFLQNDGWLAFKSPTIIDDVLGGTVSFKDVLMDGFGEKYTL